MTEDLQTIFPFAKHSFFTRLYQLYPASDYNSTFFRRAAIYGDYIINCREHQSRVSVKFETLTCLQQLTTLPRLSQTGACRPGNSSSPPAPSCTERMVPSSGVLKKVSPTIQSSTLSVKADKSLLCRGEQCHHRRVPEGLLPRLRDQPGSKQHLELRSAEATLAAVFAAGVR